MNLDIFISHFSELFDETPASEISATTAFHNLYEFSSLTALSIIAMIDEQYEVTLKGDDIRRAITVEDLFNIVKERRG